MIFGMSGHCSTALYNLIPEPVEYRSRQQLTPEVG
jgi:hypothetical protein